ncbi:MAG: DNA-directed RNA polymerase subunit beta, partial [Bacillota bacterium]
MTNPVTRTVRERKSYARNKQILEMPNLIEVQRKSYQWFLEEGIREIFDDVFPISDFTGSLSLEFVGYSLGDPKYDIDECEDRDFSYAAPLKVNVRLINKETGELKEQEVFMGEFPLMTDKGTFIINGAKRVVVSQLVRSPGAYYHKEIDVNGNNLYGSTLIPNRGAWLEFESDANGYVYVRVDRMRKIPATILIRALGYGTNADILELFDNHPAIQNTLEKDATDSVNAALVEIYKRMRPGEPPTVESASNLLHGFFFDAKRYDLGNVGRYKISKKLNNGITTFQNAEGLVWSEEEQAYVEGELENPRMAGAMIRHLTKSDIICSLQYFLEVMDGKHEPDDIDHLGNRRLRSVGELLQNQFRIGLARMERVVKERMTIQD